MIRQEKRIWGILWHICRCLFFHLIVQGQPANFWKVKNFGECEAARGPEQHRYRLILEGEWFTLNHFSVNFLLLFSIINDM